MLRMRVIFKIRIKLIKAVGLGYPNIGTARCLAPINFIKPRSGRNKNYISPATGLIKII